MQPIEGEARGKLGWNENKSYICIQKQKTQMDNNKKNDIDDLNWDHYPIFGPKTAEEAITRVNQAWEDRNDPSKWRTSEDMWNRIYEKYPWLR